jgi:hypothetical protein
MYEKYWYCPFGALRGDFAIISDYSVEILLIIIYLYCVLIYLYIRVLISKTVLIAQL